jgi:hypothetical protein
MSVQKRSSSRAAPQSWRWTSEGGPGNSGWLSPGPCHRRPPVCIGERWQHRPKLPCTFRFRVEEALTNRACQHSTFVLWRSRHLSRPLRRLARSNEMCRTGTDRVSSPVANALIDVNWTWSRSSGPVVETSRCRVSKSGFGARAADLAASGCFSNRWPNSPAGIHSPFVAAVSAIRPRPGAVKRPRHRAYCAGTITRRLACSTDPHGADQCRRKAKRSKRRKRPL